MAIVHNVEQGSQDWHRIRMGIPTSSEFHRIVTPGGKLSSQSTGYMHHLLAEILLGHPIIGEEYPWMTRGKELEEEAVRAYELHNEVDTTPGGFITNDDRTIGASPDRAVGDEGLLEIKCPAPHTHVGYMVTRDIEKEKWPQIQGQLLVTGRKWVDIMSYHPELPRVVVRVPRNVKYIALLSSALDDFTHQLNFIKENLEKEYGPIRRPQAGSPDFLSDDDVNAILESYGFARRV